MLCCTCSPTRMRRVSCRETQRSRRKPRVPGGPFLPLQNEGVRFSSQPIALVLAETFELARHAASLVRLEYSPEPPVTDLRAQRNQSRTAKMRSLLEPPP